MNNSIQFISLGPGEADLITVKGLKALQNADVIYCPCTIKVIDDNNSVTASRGGDILSDLGISKEKIIFFNLSMSKQRDEANAIYDKVYLQSKEMLFAGKQVVIVAEGDAGFYSSIHYIQDKFTKNDISIKRIAGIPAFIAAGAFAGIHIVKQEEPLLVFPGIITLDEIKEAVFSGKTVVVMKLSQCENAIKEFIKQTDQITFHYFENIGTPNQLYISNTEEIYNRKFPYFSLIIIKLLLVQSKLLH
ncbi:MAG: precorrin-2 C(20)-methyltransferase [Bacteroidales bacterium]